MFLLVFCGAVAQNTEIHESRGWSIAVVKIVDEFSSSCCRSDSVESGDSICNTQANTVGVVGERRSL